MTSAHGSTRTKPPGQKALRTNNKPSEINYVCMHVDLLLKMRSPRCVTYFTDGSPETCVTKCDSGGGQKGQNSVMYSMDGPSFMSNEIRLQKVKVFRVDSAIFPSHLCTCSASSVATGRFYNSGQPF